MECGRETHRIHESETLAKPDSLGFFIPVGIVKCERVKWIRSLARDRKSCLESFLYQVKDFTIAKEEEDI
ncbi:hypothetical protein RB195_011060 [Necator americanus]|uniref:Uncharacterized protein n=1 Tax=Necator americanus TaxID=51031 RepID=A0ABR1D0X6_NECAM